MYCYSVFFFFNDTATPEIYTLSLHDALPIFNCTQCGVTAEYSHLAAMTPCTLRMTERFFSIDRKSTRLNSSHQIISYAVFCLKKKNNRAKQISARLRSHALTSREYTSQYVIQ